MSRALGDRAARLLGPQGALRGLLSKVFPSHWSFLLGEIALISFGVLVVSGIYLTQFYEASTDPIVYQGAYQPLQGIEVSRAYASVLDISYETPGGLLARQVHHWAALVFVAAIACHAARVFFTGAFRRPRRLNWLIGVTLLGLAMANGFFGLVLPHDLLGGTGTRIGYAFATSIPVIGPGVAFVVFGGEFPDPALLHRSWQLHVLVLPALIAALLVAHLALVFLQSHTQFRSDRAHAANVVGSSAWPGYAFKTAALVTFVVAVLLMLGAVFEIAPVWLYGPFDPAAATVPAQPDWYLGWVEGALRIVPGIDLRVAGFEIPSPFLSGLLLPVLVFLALYLWPFLEERVTGDRRPHHVLDRPRDRPVRTALGGAGLAFLGVLLLAGSHDLQGLLFGVSVDTMTTAYRWLLVTVPPTVGVVTWRVCRDLAGLAPGPQPPSPGDAEGSGEPEGSGDAEGPGEPERSGEPSDEADAGSVAGSAAAGEGRP